MLLLAFWDSANRASAIIAVLATYGFGVLLAGWLLAVVMHLLVEFGAVLLGARMIRSLTAARSFIVAHRVGSYRERSPLPWERACARSAFASSFAGRPAPTEALARTGVQHSCSYSTLFHCRPQGGLLQGNIFACCRNPPCGRPTLCYGKVSATVSFTR